jgi:leucyl/phenylalanyl-tRNA--protein transferase
LNFKLKNVFPNQRIYFPPAEEASFDGILAIGGDLSPERLILAYKSGIFPWFDDNEPIFGGRHQEEWLFFQSLQNA